MSKDFIFMKWFAWLMISGCIFSACQSDSPIESPTEDEDPKQDEPITSIIAQIPDFESLSRIGFEDSDISMESIFWNEGDQICLWWENKNILTFKETNNGNKKTAKFTSNTPLEPIAYYAFYPSTVDMVKDTIKYENTLTKLDFTSAKTPEEKAKVWKDYLRKNMFFYAKGNLKGGEENVIKFEHLSSIYSFTFTNNTGTECSIDGIRFSNFISGAYNINKWNIDHIYYTSEVNLNNLIETTGLTLADGESMDFYFSVLSKQFGVGSMSMLVEYKDDYPLEHPMKDRQHIEVSEDIIVQTLNANVNNKKGQHYHFDIVKSPYGLHWDFPNAGKSVTIENVEFSAALLSRLSSNFVKLDGNGYAVMDELDAKALESILIFDYNAPITSLEGIEYFTGLKYLNLDNVQLKSCDISQNTALEMISICANELTELDLSNLQSLQYITCISNRLKYLDISALPNVEQIICGNQKDNIELTLKMTPAQKERWDNEWSINEYNNNVKVIVK